MYIGIHKYKDNLQTMGKQAKACRATIGCMYIKLNAFKNVLSHISSDKVVLAMLFSKQSWVFPIK